MNERYQPVDSRGVAAAPFDQQGRYVVSSEFRHERPPMVCGCPQFYPSGVTAVSSEFRLPPQHAATSGVQEVEMKGRLAVFSILLAAAKWVSVAAQGPDESRPPLNLKVDALIQPVVERMWRASTTLRRQCRRLAAEHDLQVTVAREDQPGRASFANARTALTFHGTGPEAAHVYLKNS